MKKGSEKVVSLAGRRITKRQLLDWLYHEYSQAMRGLFCARLGEREDIEDLLHDAFVRLSQMPDLQQRVASGQGVSKSFVLTIANNLIIDNYRHIAVKRRYQEKEAGLAESRVDEASPELLAHKHEVLAVIEQALRELPKPVRDAFILSRFENLSHAEIGKQLRLTHRSVETYIGKALLSVRNAVEKLDGEGHE